MEETIASLTGRMAEAEVALQKQCQERRAHMEATLGPIRDEAARLVDALEEERKARKLMEERDEKLIADHVESITVMIDKEKFAREQQHMDFRRWADIEHQRVAKR